MMYRSDMTQEEFTLHVNMSAAALSLLSNLREIGLTSFQYECLEVMGHSIDEIDSVLDYKDTEWKEILAAS